MSTIICYYSRHQGNTLKLLEAMTAGADAELFDVTSRMAVDLSLYDRVGFASGIYAGSFHESVSDFARQYLPEGKDVFLVATSASGKGGPGRLMNALLRDKKAHVLGRFICHGMTTFGPFGWVHGFPKGHPDEEEMAKARKFYHALPGRE